MLFRSGDGQRVAAGRQRAAGGEAAGIQRGGRAEGDCAGVALRAAGDLGAQGDAAGGAQRERIIEADSVDGDRTAEAGSTHCVNVFHIPLIWR